MVDPVQVASAVTEIARKYKKPVLGCFMGIKDILRTIHETSQSLIPLYAFPESAARAMSGMVRYARLKEQPFEEPASFDVDSETVSAVLDQVKKEGRSILRTPEAFSILNAYGIPSAPIRIAHNLEEAVKEARGLGYPVVMKALMEEHQHKSDFGGVKVDLRNDSEVIDAFTQIQSTIRSAGLQNDWKGVYLQPMVRSGKEVIMGMVYDPTFGPLLMFGLGGIYVETLRDTTFRIIPISRSDAHAMIRSIKAFPILKGVRGEAGIDIEFLAEVLQRLSQLASDFHEIQELEINPFIAFHDRKFSLAVDVRMRIAAS